MSLQPTPRGEPGFVYSGVDNRVVTGKGDGHLLNMLGDHLYHEQCRKAHRNMPGVRIPLREEVTLRNVSVPLQETQDMSGIAELLTMSFSNDDEIAGREEL